MDSAAHFSRLYAIQDEALAILSRLDTGLYLSGGTAASRGYLGHRYSDDLDLFVNDAPDFVLWSDRFVDALSHSDRWVCSILLREARFVRVVLQGDDIDLKIEMINDVPSHVGKIRVHPALGRLDSPENILANKVTAVLDRSEPKDLADIWGFTSLLGLSLHAAITGAQGKAAGVFPADVARALYTVNDDDWALIRWIEAPAREVFVGHLRRVAEELLLSP